MKVELHWKNLIFGKSFSKRMVFKNSCKLLLKIKFCLETQIKTLYTQNFQNLYS